MTYNPYDNYDPDDDLTDEEWIAKHTAELDDQLNAQKATAPKASPDPTGNPKPTESLDHIAATATSEAEFTRRMRDAGVPMTHNEMPLTADGRMVDSEAPQFDMGGMPVNEAGWKVFRERHPEYAELEKVEPRYISDGVSGQRLVVD